MRTSDRKGNDSLTEKSLCQRVREKTCFTIVRRYPTPIVFHEHPGRKKLFSGAALTANRSDWQIAPSLFDAEQIPDEFVPSYDHPAFHLLCSSRGPENPVFYDTGESFPAFPVPALYAREENSVTTLTA